MNYNLTDNIPFACGVQRDNFYESLYCEKSNIRSINLLEPNKHTPGLDGFWSPLFLRLDGRSKKRAVAITIQPIKNIIIL